MKRLLAVLLLATLLLPGAPHLSARPDPNAPIMVETARDGVDRAPGDGVCADTDGGCTLRAAIQESNALDGTQTVIVPAGVYMLTIAGRVENRSASGDLDLTADVVLEGAGAEATVIDAAGLDRALSVITATAPISVTIGGLNLRAGHAQGEISEPGDGGALLVGAGARALVRDSVIRENSATGSGGGVFLDGALTMLRSEVLSNSVPIQGGGMMLFAPTAALTVSSSTIADNSATIGGGIFKEAGRIVLADSLVAGNRAVNSGSGLYNYGGPAAIRNTTFSGNQSGGGVILNDNQNEVTLINSTIAANLDKGFVDVHGAGSPLFRTYNTIIAGNSLADCQGPLHSLGHTLLGSLSGCAYHAAPGDITNVAAGLAPLADNGGPTLTHALLPGSPDIDAGGAADCPASDQRGRLRAAPCDIGAFELAKDELWSLFLPLVRR